MDGRELVAKADMRVQIIPGFQAVGEALGRDKPKIQEIWANRDRKGPRMEELLALAKDKGIPVLLKSGQELDALLPRVPHQGVLAVAEGFAYRDLGEIIRISHGDVHGLIIVADHITDEGNLGALIRSAAFFGAHGLVLPKDRSARITERVLKRSAGACAHLSVAREVNLGRVLDTLDKEGFWIVGAAGEGPETIYGFDWCRDLALVLGSEDRGLSRSTRERCHAIVRIPGPGNVESLNVSVACGVILSEIGRQRNAAKRKGRE